MNQTQKRLSIIKLAISITDIETIQLQIAKLRLLRADVQIQNIIDALDSESYALAQSLIQEYIDTPIQAVHQRVTNEKHGHTYTTREQELIEEFDLFITENSNEEEYEISDINQYLQTSAAPSKVKPEVDFDKLSEMDEKEEETERSVFPLEDSMVSKTDVTSKEFLSQKEEIETLLESKPLSEETTENVTIPEEMKTESIVEIKPAPVKTSSPANAQEKSNDTVSPVDKHTNYQPIFSIKQQFLDASQKYPLLISSTQPYDSVTEWIDQISHEEGYKKIDVEETVLKALKLAEGESSLHRSEAAELLLLSGLTEDEFGQLILAREFFKGRLFEKNMSEAFNRIQQLAATEYPEAICDLAQFYEHGIATKKNKKRAKELYEKAMHFGIKRAQRHFERLNKEGGLFSF